MPSVPNLTFVVAANDKLVLNNNLLASPCLAENCHELIIQEGYSSAAAAYNDAIERSSNDLIVCVHQDVFLPKEWTNNLRAALQRLSSIGPEWGVLGCCGMKQDGRRFGYIYTPGESVIGHPFPVPEPVQTLDELVLVLRKSSQLRFSGDLPGFHFYGTDICLAAAARGLACYAFSAFCVHNARQYFAYPEDFYEAYRFVKDRWKDWLPIQTSCIRITRFDSDLRKQRIKKTVASIFGRPEERGSRLDDPRMILQRVGPERRS